jgi:hypothetical protein
VQHLDHLFAPHGGSEAAGLDDPLEEGLGAGVGRLGEDLLGRALLADDPLVRKQTRLDASRAIVTRCC